MMNQNDIRTEEIDELRDLNVRQSKRNRALKKKGSYHIIRGLFLIICQKPRLEDKVPHMDERLADLSPAVSDHPSLVHHLRHASSRRSNLCALEIKNHKNRLDGVPTPDSTPDSAIHGFKERGAVGFPRHRERRSWGLFGSGNPGRNRGEEELMDRRVREERGRGEEPTFGASTLNGHDEVVILVGVFCFYLFLCRIKK